MDTDLALIRLLQLVSPSLPIGLYSYSQGMEQAVDSAWVTDEHTTGLWVGGLMERSVSRVDMPILIRLYHAWSKPDPAAVEYWSRQLRAHRETAELRAEDRHTGQALARVLINVPLEQATPWLHHDASSLATVFALAAVTWNIPLSATLNAYLFGWLENQILCAVKLIPLGQSAGQRLLFTLASQIPALTAETRAMTDDDIGGSSLAQVLASSRHETQYTRLFRS
ncbi:MAG: urease accessory protein UreF [Methylococcaceae bacterium]